MECSEGTLLGGRVRYAQPVQGYRTGIEPVLLAACIPAKAGERVLEAGTGAGAGLLCLGHRVPGLVGLGIERDAEMACLARRNLAANSLPFDIIEADVAALPSVPPCHHVLANPPWHNPASTRPIHTRRDSATHRGAGGLATWIAALLPLAARSLTLVLASALAGDAIAQLHAAHFGRLVICPLWPRSGQPAKIVLIQAAPGGGPSRVAPGLVLHGEGNGYTPETESLLRSGGALSL